MRGNDGDIDDDDGGDFFRISPFSCVVVVIIVFDRRIWRAFFSIMMLMVKLVFIALYFARIGSLCKSVNCWQFCI